MTLKPTTKHRCVFAFAFPYHSNPTLSFAEVYEFSQWPVWRLSPIFLCPVDIKVCKHCKHMAFSTVYDFSKRLTTICKFACWRLKMSLLSLSRELAGIVTPFVEATAMHAFLRCRLLMTDALFENKLQIASLAAHSISCEQSGGFKSSRFWGFPLSFCQKCVCGQLAWVWNTSPHIVWVAWSLLDKFGLQGIRTRGGGEVMLP